MGRSGGKAALLISLIMTRDSKFLGQVTWVHFIRHEVDAFNCRWINKKRCMALESAVTCSKQTTSSGDSVNISAVDKRHGRRMHITGQTAFCLLTRSFNKLLFCFYSKGLCHLRAFQSSDQ